MPTSLGSQVTALCKSLAPHYASMCSVNHYRTLDQRVKRHQQQNDITLLKK